MFRILCVSASLLLSGLPIYLYWVLKHPNASILVPNPPSDPQSQVLWPPSRNPPDIPATQQVESQHLMGTFRTLLSIWYFKIYGVCVCVFESAYMHFPGDRTYISFNWVVQEVFEPKMIGNHGARTIIPLWHLALSTMPSNRLRSLDLHIECLAKIFKNGWASQ